MFLIAAFLLCFLLYTTYGTKICWEEAFRRKSFKWWIFTIALTGILTFVWIIVLVLTLG